MSEERFPISLDRYCFSCGEVQPILLPVKPEGLGECMACGTTIDLFDFGMPERREYLACFPK